MTELLEDFSFSISEDSSFFISPVTKILISISPSAKISLRVFSPSVRIVFANSPESVTVPFSTVMSSISSVPIFYFFSASGKLFSALNFPFSPIVTSSGTLIRESTFA